MRIPLTLAIVPALIVESCGQSFALPQAAIQELVHIPAGGSRSGVNRVGGLEPGGRVDPGGSVEWIGSAPFYRLRDRLLPLVFLDKVLELEHERRPDPQRRIFVVVLEADGRSYGLAVDGLADPEEIVIKPQSPVVKEIGLFSAATVLGNGELALILDPGAIAARAGVEISEEEINKLHKADDAHHASAQPSVGREYLLVEAAGRRVAVPLESVVRIQRVQAEQIEYAAGRPVLFDGGHLLSIDDSFGVLAAPGSDPDTSLAIVVCRHGARQYGIAVSRVLDVAAGQPLMDAATGHTVAGVTLLAGKVTEVVDLFLDLGGEPDFEMRVGSKDTLTSWAMA
jgi:two-component system, chemotaxis family, sensor kinase CheA